MTKRVDDATGLKFGRWTVISSLNRHKWECICECGTTKDVNSGNLRQGKTKSCGCLQKELVASRRTTHKMSHLAIYNVWKNMLYRCKNRKHNAYKYYGGRGISVCRAWEEDPLNFAKWAIGNGYSEGLELDRKDTNGNYEPNNCRFIVHRANSLNKRLLRINNVTGYRGVYKSHHGKFAASLRSHGVKKHLGYFSNPKSAATARDEYITENHLDLPLNSSKRPQ